MTQSGHLVSRAERLIGALLNRLTHKINLSKITLRRSSDKKLERTRFHEDPDAISGSRRRCSLHAKRRGLFERHYLRDLCSGLSSQVHFPPPPSLPFATVIVIGRLSVDWIAVSQACTKNTS